MVKNFGEYLRQKRGKRTLAELSSKADISVSYLCKVENNERNAPSAKILKQIAKAYGFTYREIMEAAGYYQPSDQLYNDDVDDSFSALVSALKTEGIFDLSDKIINELVKYAKYLKYQNL